MVTWNENMIAAALARQVLNRNALVVVPNCGWTGHECDLLVVCRDLRVIDIEIKISRADLRADAKKDKWYHNWDWKTDGPWRGKDSVKRRREWPQRVWKHYYCMPADIWTDDLVAALPSDASGVTLLREANNSVVCSVQRRATPCRDAKKISAEAAVDIARLASLRMWDALAAAEARRG